MKIYLMEFLKKGLAILLQMCYNCDAETKINIKTMFYTEGYRSGDVAERCQWQKKRGVRSGSGRNFVSESEQKISGTATGHNEAVLKCLTDIGRVRAEIP